MITAWLTRLCPKSPTPLPAPSRRPGPPAATTAADAAALAALAALATPDAALGATAAVTAATATASPPAPPDEAGCRCGWFDSSLDLRQGLAVSELADPDWTVMVLWFGPAALRRSARLH